MAPLELRNGAVTAGSQQPSQPSRLGLLCAAALASCALAGPLLARPSPVLVWNASASSPLGLYRISAPVDLAPGDMVVAWPPASMRRLAAKRSYLPFNVPLVKPVAASAGARVCAKGAYVLVDGRLAAVRRTLDRAGRLLPWWSGCRLLGQGELFLLSRTAPNAFDGRYFGVTRAKELVGKARLVWQG